MFAPVHRLWTSVSPPTRQFGIPFIAFLVAGTYGLSFLTAGRYELDDERRVRAQIGADPRKPGGGGVHADGGAPGAGGSPTAVAAPVLTAAPPGPAAGSVAATATAAAPGAEVAAGGAGAATDYTMVRIPRRGERPPPRAG
ncbi:hypothetical protein MMPV_008390 [Pyropia vietnamensis]